jgi:alpha-beta hydrolase superfamily lysophospholipase
VGILGVLAIVLSLWQLLSERQGITRTDLLIGQTPATLYVKQGAAPAPLVVIAHGFAGSRQFMEAFSLTLAGSGYTALAFDFQGHGRNPVPMSGDVSRIDGTTQLLMDETSRVIDAGLARPEVSGGVSLLGHSMATDVIARVAVRDARVDAVVGVSMFSQAVTQDQPERLLMVAGAWEPHLRDFGLAALRMVDPKAVEGDTVRNGDVVRRSVAAPHTEHVSVLYSETTLRAARDFLDDTYDRQSRAQITRHGPWVGLLLAGILALGWPLFSRPGVGVGAGPGAGHVVVPSWRVVLVVSLVPASLVPLVLSLFETRVLPVLVADYLALHLAFYGAVQLGLLAWFGIRPGIGKQALLPAAMLLVYGIFGFGFALDQFGASFVPHAGRVVIIAAVALGAVPFMLGDAVACAGGAAPVLRRLTVRAGFLASLVLAVVLDFERLFFLVMIIPVIVLFFLIFGTMGGWVGRRAGPAASGLALGVILAWAIGVSFPLFSV